MTNRGDKLTSVIFASMPPFWYQHPDFVWEASLPFLILVVQSGGPHWVRVRPADPLPGTGILVERHKVFQGQSSFLPAADPQRTIHGSPLPGHLCCPES